MGLVNNDLCYIIGWVADEVGSYDPTFYMSGAIIIFSVLMLFLVPCLRKCDKIASRSLNENIKVELNNGNADPGVDDNDYPSPDEPDDPSPSPTITQIPQAESAV